MSNYFLQVIWRKTESVLKQTERIFFCGYSFPDADIHIKYLLKRIEINRGSSPEIFIINNHDKKAPSQKILEKERYMRFFSDTQKVKYLDMSFEDFCHNDIDSTTIQEL